MLQRDREDGVGRLAKAAQSDRSFPREGDANAVRAHLNRMQADGDSFEAVDDAETDWLSY
ncbi:YozE family protein [Sphingomonas sp. PL-96]|nr:YozE family protein [Sphingomonas sp. PL-96]